MKHEWYWWNDLYSKEEIKTINSIVSLVDQPADLYDKNAPIATKTASVKVLPMGFYGDILKKFNDKLQRINRTIFGFDLYETIMEECVNYNVYDAKDKGEYSWHVDAEQDEPFDIKLTAILNLSEEPYEGGEFEIFANHPSHIPEFTPGTLLVFPGFLPHRVKPVTKGKRITLSRWATGPNWR